MHPSFSSCLLLLLGICMDGSAFLLMRRPADSMRHRTGSKETTSFVANTRTSSFTSTTADPIIRPVGGYEKLMNRKIPGSSSVALSHGAAYILNGGDLDVFHLTRALALCVEKHPMLASYVGINQDAPEHPVTGPELVWMKCPGSCQTVAEAAISWETAKTSFEASWKQELEQALNSPEFPAEGPQWRLKIFHTDNQTALVFCMNHGLDDQQSLNILVADLLHYYHALVSGISIPALDPIPFPRSMEEAVSPEGPGLATVDWAIFQLCNAAAGALTMPERTTVELTKIDPGIQETRKHLNEKYMVENRRTIIEFFRISKEKLSKVRVLCKAHGVTVTNFLSAMMIFLTDQAILGDKAGDEIARRQFRFLLSVGLRPFGKNGDKEKDWTGGTIACAGGALDFIVPLHGSNFLATDAVGLPESFWKTAKTCRASTKDLLGRGFVQESVRLFGLGMKYADILKVVEMAAANPSGLGREYSCGVSNVGVINFPPLDSESKQYEETEREERDPEVGLQKYGGGESMEKGSKRRTSGSGVMPTKVRPIEAYYGTSHARNGVVCQLSCQTVNGELFGCMQFPLPILSSAEASRCRQNAEAFIESFI